MWNILAQSFYHHRQESVGLTLLTELRCFPRAVRALPSSMGFGTVSARAGLCRREVTLKLATLSLGWDGLRYSVFCLALYRRDTISSIGSLEQTLRATTRRIRHCNGYPKHRYLLSAISLFRIFGLSVIPEHQDIVPTRLCAQDSRHIDNHACTCLSVRTVARLMSLCCSVATPMIRWVDLFLRIALSKDEAVSNFDR
jgi:hypothetical protein